MKVILKKEVAHLGEADEVVEVRPGYALNYLIPQGFAAMATKSALKQHEETLRQRAHKEAKLVEEAASKMILTSETSDVYDAFLSGVERGAGDGAGA